MTLDSTDKAYGQTYYKCVLPLTIRLIVSREEDDEEYKKRLKISSYFTKEGFRMFRASSFSRICDSLYIEVK